MSETEVATLVAAFDTAIPTDDWPGGRNGGVRALLSEHGAGFMSWAIPQLQQAARALDDAARDAGYEHFSELPTTQREKVFSDLLAAENPC
jgi:hypothetical protein